MTKVLFISNIEVPYRSEFFNQLSKKVNLTVLYERKKSSNRDTIWTSSVKSKYRIDYLNGLKLNKEYTFDIKILKYIFSKKYEKIIIGCYNSPSQMIAIFFMKLLRKKYILNLDGEYFLDGNSLKQKIKRYFIRGADKYLIAGKKSAQNLSKYISKDKIYTYYFSSLTNKEINENAKKINVNKNDTVLVIGQYFDYKGLDIALEIAALNQNIKYKFIGSGNRSDLLKDKVAGMKLKNVEIIPFLKKEELYVEYQTCKCLLLTSRRECWGLVINEAASFGCPIIASKYAGAAMDLVEKRFLIDVYGDKLKILDIIENNEKLLAKESKLSLMERNKNYSIENTVISTEKVLNN